VSSLALEIGSRQQQSRTQMTARDPTCVADVEHSANCGVKTEKVPQLPSKASFSKRFEEAVGLAC
jgi:hypothetical protein